MENKTADLHPQTVSAQPLLILGSILGSSGASKQSPLRQVREVLMRDLGKHFLISRESLGVCFWQIRMKLYVTDREQMILNLFCGGRRCK